jgi:tetratricopeptide (TPR) repeat protein
LTTLRLVALAIWLVPLGAQARGPEKAARKRFDEGLAHYRAGRWDEAIESFRAAQAIAPAAELHFNIAQAYRMKGACAEALEEYRRYLEEDPDSPNRGPVRQYLNEMAACAAEPEPEPDETAEPEMPIEEAAAHEPQAADDDERPRVPAPIGSDDAERPSGSAGQGKRVIGLIVLGAGIALVGGGYGFGRVAAEKEDQVGDAFLNGDAWSPELADAEEDGKRAAVISAVMYTAGAAMIAGGTVSWLLGRRETSRLRVAPVAGRRGAGLGVSWTF